MEPSRLVATQCLLGLACLLLRVGKADVLDEDDSLKFPDAFLFGVGTSSYQTEGAWNEDGKGENVLDHLCHVMGIPNGDVACDSYHRFKEDIALAAEMKIDVYRFSISWARIFPNGRRESLEKRGVQHYHDVIDELLKYGIKPMITIEHYETPQTLLDEMSGWQSSNMVDIFVDYADFLFEEYGYKVQHWTTINEPNVFCQTDLTISYLIMVSPQMYYTCMHNKILGHAAVHRLYHEKYAEKQKGFVGISAVSFFARPSGTEYDDIAAADRVNSFNMGVILHPLVYGDYPPVVRELLSGNGTTPSALPAFTEEQKILLRGAIDFFGVNAYDALIVSDILKTSGLDLSEDVPGPRTFSRLTEARASLVDLPSCEWILAEAAQWINANYGRDLQIFITENGVPGLTSVHDWDIRTTYVRDYLGNLLKATHRYDLNVIGYSYWAFLDTFEFSTLYSVKRGIVQVDFESGSLNRTLRDSWRYFKDVATTRRLPPTAASDSCHTHFALSTLLLPLAIICRVM